MKVGYERFTIYEVEDLHRAILLELSNADELLIDFQGVNKIDVVAIQLLLSAYKTCQKDSKKFTLTNLSTELQHTIAVVGCTPLLGTMHE